MPSLPREQREEVIRKPLERAGASIEPELVERLLNDSSDELDQLPVLQHCLLRLWEKAGTASEGPSGTDASVQMREPREQPSAARHLTVAHYRAIGGMTNALSQHADELLSKLQGRERAVEQTFRALSEVDREGRAIRRGLRFQRLCAETGVAESELREVLDRFRADDCSFLLRHFRPRRTWQPIR